MQLKNKKNVLLRQKVFSKNEVQVVTVKINKVKCTTRIHQKALYGHSYKHFI